MLRYNPARERAMQAVALTPEQVRQGAPAGFFGGALTAPLQGVAAGAMQTSGLLYGAAGSLVRGYNQILAWQDMLASKVGLPESGKISTEWLDAQKDNALNFAHTYKPDPLRTGMAGQVLYELSRVMTQVGTGAGVAAATGGTGAAALWTGAATTGASTTFGKFDELKKDGVDDKTALQVAAIEGLVTGGGVMVPASIGYRLGANIAYGAGANIGLGMAERGTVHALLKDNYPAMAAHYQPLDAAALIAEGALGAIFGAVGARAGLRQRAQEITDAALVARDAKHAAIDTAPGIPADPKTANAHTKALNEAIEQLLGGKPIEVSATGVGEGNFVPRARDHAVPDAVRTDYDTVIQQDVRALQNELHAMADVPESVRAELSARYERAADAKPRFDAALARIAEETGVTLQTAKIKDVARAVDKIVDDYNGNASRIKDLVRATLVVETNAQLEQVLRRVMRVMKARVKRNNLVGERTTSDTGYRDALIEVDFDGFPAELQISTPEMMVAKKKAHPLYVEQSKLEREIQAQGRKATQSEQAKIDAWRAQQREFYVPAWEATMARNSASSSIAPFHSKDMDGNGLPSGTSQAVTEKSGALATGTSSTSANRVPSGNDSGNSILGITEPPDASLPLTAARASDDLDTQAGLRVLEEHGDMSVPVELESGEVVHVSLQDALREADTEAAYVRPDTLNAAVACGLTKG